MGIPDVVSQGQDLGAIQESRPPTTNSTDPHELFYRVEDVPEWPTNILFGFQVLFASNLIKEKYEMMLIMLMTC